MIRFTVSQKKRLQMHKSQCMNVKIDGGKSIKLDPTMWLAVNMSNEEELLCRIRNYVFL